MNAVLCAGDLFDDPTPSEDFWEGLAKTFRDHPGPHVPIFLVPGNHDPLTPESVWAPTHPFRSRLPTWVHVVDRDDFSYELAPDAVLYASPCRSKAGENDLAMALPAREPGDTRLRIGCVHGCTFDIDGYQTNFPICRDAGVQRGLDYLAIGDTHSFRDVTDDSAGPDGLPRRARADELRRAGRRLAWRSWRCSGTDRGRASRRSRSAFWRWIDVTVPRHQRAAHAADHAGPRASRRQAAPRHGRVAGGRERGRAHPARPSGHRRDARPRRHPAGRPDEPAAAAGFRRRLPRRSAAGGQGHHRAPRPHRSKTPNDEAEKVRATRALAHLYKLLQSHEAAVGARRDEDPPAAS